MIERIVVPVDFTHESDRALGAAPVLADWAGASIELLTVVAPWDRAGVEADLAVVAQRLGEGTTWRCLESGAPVAAVLVRELRRDQKELWCVGSHARTAFGEALVGSLSEDLVRRSHSPIVLVGPHAVARRSGRVLAVALDGTPESEGILPAATSLAGAMGLSLTLLQVVDRTMQPLPGDVTQTAYLAASQRMIPACFSEGVDYDVLHGGHPAHNLADYVDVHGEIGMIAMATRGLAGGARLRHGSTAFELAHHATVPVMVLHQVRAVPKRTNVLAAGV